MSDTPIFDLVSYQRALRRGPLLLAEAGWDLWLLRHRAETLADVVIDLRGLDRDYSNGTPNGTRHSPQRRTSQIRPTGSQAGRPSTDGVRTPASLRGLS